MGWREERDRAVAARAAALARQQEVEAERARGMIAAFVKEALAAGLPRSPLVCRAYEGKAKYRTGISGWYLNSARTVAVDPDGNYYVLLVPRSLAARFVGAKLQPQRPRLIVGEGGRDGESVPLQELLRRRLEES